MKSAILFDKDACIDSPYCEKDERLDMTFCFYCTAIAAGITGLSGMLIGFLLGKNMLSLPSLQPLFTHSIYISSLSLGLLCALIGLCLGALLGLISSLCQKNKNL